MLRKAFFRFITKIHNAKLRMRNNFSTPLAASCKYSGWARKLRVSLYNLLLQKKKIPVERILQEPLYLTERGISYRYAMEQALATAGFAVKPFLEIGNTDVITHFIKQGFGISFLPEYVVKDDVADGRLAVLDVDLPPITMWSQLVYHKSKLLTPQISNDSR